jgi:hypothetical protein
MPTETGCTSSLLKLNEQNMEDDVITAQEDLNTWKTKTLQGKLSNSLQKNHVDKESSLLWLSTGYIYPEMEYFAVTTQDQVIKTRNYEKHYLGMEVTDRSENVIKCATQLNT